MLARAVRCALAHAGYIRVAGALAGQTGAFRHAWKALAMLLWGVAPQRCVCAVAAQTCPRLYIKILARLTLPHTLRCSCVDSTADLSEGIL